MKKLLEKRKFQLQKKKQQSRLYNIVNFSISKEK